MRERLPATRQSVVHKFKVAGHKGYVSASFYPDGRVGELFITIAKDGSTIAGLLECVAILTSVALQNGVSLDTIVDKMIGQKFEPSGQTINPAIPMADSIVDYIFRWLKKEQALHERK